MNLVSTHLMNCLLDEFNEKINSKRVKSRITTIEDLIQVLWNRNSLQGDDVLKYVCNNEQRDIVCSYINSLCYSENVDGSGNRYGILHFEIARILF